MDTVHITLSMNVIALVSPNVRIVSFLLQASFPGNLHLVLVLRPTSFFHRTVTDIGFRFSQDDFMLKMPVSSLCYQIWNIKYVSCVFLFQHILDLFKIGAQIKTNNK